ncbi:MAG: enoyl-CoA hydratase/isomerase family protein [Rhodoferax sp.]|uniref:enoyl-CoA hydratase/isomerase family protein n=1 Tax=Rhodoferax sp. TaxID=50421 RepID=UPI0027292368|nr:enoyl-CoA hydratase/isomerase family protein [Rhodoferax sp.]MDO8450031.1 enoyl-CoA hydratase/isomerase family protein [Rhodoferax sp.]
MTAKSDLPSGDAPDVLTEVRGQVGFITLNRPKALNALSLGMIRALTECLQVWRDDPAVKAVAIRGTSKTGPFGAFCAGGDIRFFHQAALAGNPELEDFFTEEYALNHLIHTYPKPYIAFMDGIVMGGGMGISQGAKIRIVTERTRMAMPETNIGLFPDVGGGYFLSRCPGRIGEWLALTGEMMGVGEALAFGLADACLDVSQLAPAWDALASTDFARPDAIESWLAMHSIAAPAYSTGARSQIDHYFALPLVVDIVRELEADTDEWAQHTAASLRKRSPLMLHVVLEQIRRARTMSLADDLRMERDMVRHCFHTRHLERSASQSETVEGIRALAVDKDHTPRWNPARIEDVTPAMVAPFFSSPWTPRSHPLRELT